MTNILTIIGDLANLYARSKGFRPFDHLIELDMFLPWSFREELHHTFSNMANVVSTVCEEETRKMLEDRDNRVRFTQLRLPQNILINLYDGDDFVIRLTKKPGDPAQFELPFPQDAGERGKVVEMYPEKQSAA